MAGREPLPAWPNAARTGPACPSIEWLIVVVRLPALPGPADWVHLLFRVGRVVRSGKLLHGRAVSGGDCERTPLPVSWKPDAPSTALSDPAALNNPAFTNNPAFANHAAF